jgi:hypothetical protein
MSAADELPAGPVLLPPVALPLVLPFLPPLVDVSPPVELVPAEPLLSSLLLSPQPVNKAVKVVRRASALHRPREGGLVEFMGS